MKPRRHPLFVLATVSALAVLPLLAQAQESARVLSSTPVLQKVGIPQQVCTDTQVATPEHKTGAGAVIGAIAGGAVGNSMGQGSGKAAATALGLFGGAILGNKIEGGTPGGVETVKQCSTQTVYQDKVVGYNVVYEYAGKQYSVQSQQDPGPYLQVQVVPVLPGPPQAVVLPPRREHDRPWR